MCSKVRLAGNVLGVDGASSLAAVLRGNRCLALESLHLNRCSMPDEAVAIIAQALAENDTLCGLGLGLP